ncbi:MAG: LysM peptidoglycan-binding domain-containing protein [Nitrospiraceae bacterium]|nr:MAG: LysM peptidoglycan-binding domain-containing protein [Nitrospiraceae bacterium]
MKKIIVAVAASVAIMASVMSMHLFAAEDYIIQKGDNLWDISDSKLDDTLLWPKLWNVNPEIENPDLIYPGTRIRIPSPEELQKISPVPLKKKKRRVKKAEPKHIFKQRELITQKYIISRDLFISSGWIAKEFPGIGMVKHEARGGEIAGEGETVYLQLEEGGSPGNYIALRNARTVKHPMTGELIGYQVKVTGILEATGMDGNLTKALITTSYDDVEVGNAILPYTPVDPPLIQENPRRPDMSGYVISTHTTGHISGEGDVIFLDKGESDGLKVGDVFSAITDSPVERVDGELQVISLRPTTASAVLLSSNKEITIGSKWGQPKK